MYNKSLTIVFQHGFGFTNSFWKYLIPYFKQNHCMFLEDNYFSKPSCSINENHIQFKNVDVAIGHSLGFVKLLDQFSHVKYLIGLNAFSDFLCRESELYNIRLNEYNIFRKQFTLNAHKTLKSFYKRCGITDYQNDLAYINKSLMLHDIDLLSNRYNIPTDQKILIINTQNDIIIPMNVARHNFNRENIKIHYLPNGNHILGIVYPEIISKMILEFIT